MRRGELKNLIQEKRLNHLIIDFSWDELNRKELNFVIAFCPEMMQSLEHELLHHIPSWQRGERHRIPNAEEKCDCCRGIRSPSRRWPFSFINHCNTHNHVFNFWMKHHKKDLLQNLRRVVTDLEHRQEEGNKLTHKEKKLLKLITKIIPTNRNLYLLL